MKSSWLHGVTIIGEYNLAGTVPYHASQMYARNISTFLLHLVKDGKLQLNLQDEIMRETLLTQGGEIVNAKVREFFSLPALAERACRRSEPDETGFDNRVVRIHAGGVYRI